MIRNQATRIEPPQPATGAGEKAGCLVALLLFLGAVASVYFSPWVVSWIYFAITSRITA